MIKGSLKRVLIFSLIIVFVFTLTGICNASATSDNKNDLLHENQFSLSLCYNEETTLNTEQNTIELQNKFSDNIDNIKSSKTKIDLKLTRLEDIIVEQATPFIAEANLKLGDKKYSLEASGNLMPIKVESGNIVFVGVLSGYLNGIQESDYITDLSIHFIPHKGESFISATFGVLTDDKRPATIDFGKSSDEIKEAVKKVVEIKGMKNNSASDENTVLNNSFVYPMDYGSNPPLDTDPQLQGYSSTCNSSLFTSVIFQKKGRYQTNNLISGKISLNYNNTCNYIKSLVPNIKGSPWCENASLQLWTTAPAFVCTSTYDPKSNETNVSFPLYFYVPYLSIGWQSLNISFTTSSTTVSWSPCAGAPAGQKNFTTWSFYRFLGLAGVNSNHALETTSKNALDAACDSKGLGAQAIYTYTYGVASNTSIKIGVDSIAKICYLDAYGNQKVLSMECLASNYMTITPN